MSKTLTTCIVMMIVVSGIDMAFASSTTDQPLAGHDFTTTGVDLAISRTSPEFTSISFISPGVEVLEVVKNFETYHAMILEGEPFLAVDGSPAVPRITRLYRIPNSGGVELVIRQAEFELQEGINPYPYHEETAPFQRDARNPAVYQNDAWYPSEIATVSEPIIMRDFRLVEVTLYPVQVNPVTGHARVYSRIDVDIVANSEPSVNELLNPRQISGSWTPIYRDLISNLDETALDDATTTPGSYLILAENDAQMSRWVDSLALWKQRRGFDVIVDERVGWTAGQMNTAIQNYYNTSETPLEFVCLMGDPAWSAGVPVDGSNYDHTFALTAGSDDVEDVGVGRLSGSTGGIGGEMHTIIAKLMMYEREPYMADTQWFQRAFLYAGVSYGVASNYLVMQWTDQQLALHTGVDNNVVLTHYGSVDNSTVISQLEAGRSIFLWRGSWVGQMGTSLAASINTGPRLPLCFTVTCGTGDYQSGLDVSESYLVAGTPTSPRGGVCGIGTATLGTHSEENNTLAGGLVYAIANSGVEHLGNSLAFAKAWLGKTFGAGSSSEFNFSRWCNLLGDPGMSIWTDVPTIINASHLSSLRIGAGEYSVTATDPTLDAPIEGALVVLWKGSETYVKGLTDAAGQITLPITIDTAGDLLLTITKRNHKPYLASIPCTAASRYVSYESLTVDDDNSGGTSGNNNDILNPGETIDLAITVRNNGTSLTATGISAALTSLNSNVTVISGSSTYPTLAPGTQAAGNSTYRIQIDPEIQHHEVVYLELDVLASSQHVISRIEFIASAGDLNFVSKTFIGGSPIPGSTRDLEVTVLNSGEVNLSNVQGILFTDDPLASIVDNFGTFGSINVGAQGTNTTDRFTITAAATAFNGHQALLGLALTASDGEVDTTYFFVSLGTRSSVDPAGPDTYGYFAYDNTDTNYDLAPQFSYVNITGTGTDLNLNDIGDKSDISQIWSTVRTLPFSFSYYGEIYNQVTICSNGWLAFGSQGWNDSFRNFPIPAQSAPSAMVAPYWDDLKTSNTGQGVWEYYDAVNHRYLVQWKAGCGTSYSQEQLDFEVILFDEDYYPTGDDNGKILVQYNDIAMNLPNGRSGSEAPGSTVGIQDPLGTDGLAYAYQNSYMSGAATIVNSRAILYTTDNAGIIGLNFNLIDPNGGEMLFIGDPFDVAWSPGEVTGNIKIELSRDGLGGPWSLITASTANDGFYQSTVTGPQSETCRVRITPLSFPDSTDLSQDDFRIASIVEVLFEDFESGAAGWTHEAGNGWGDNWHISTEMANTGASSYKCGDTGAGTYDNSLDARLISPVIPNLPESAFLDYSQWIEAEISTAFPDSAYDGGFVEISVNAGPFTVITPLQSYEYVFRYESGGGSPFSGPVPGGPCFSSDVTLWNSISFDLTSYVGSDVQFRWRFCSDAGAALEGWYIDDVRIYGIGTTPEPIVPSELTISIHGIDVTLRWAADANAAYQVFSSPNADLSGATLRATTSNNSVVFANEATDALLFYYVVGYSGE